MNLFFVKLGYKAFEKIKKFRNTCKHDDLKNKQNQTMINTIYSHIRIRNSHTKNTPQKDKLDNKTRIIICTSKFKKH